MRALEGGGRSAPVATPAEIYAAAAVIAAVLFGLAGVIGAIGYLVSVSRYRP